MTKRIPTLLFCAALLSGCDSSLGPDGVDEKNTFVQQGLNLAQLKRWEDAIQQFEQALDTDSQLARADLELALIYHQQQKNYVRAIYHYERYLEKRPESEKRELITNWIDQAKVSFSAEIGRSDDGVSEELVRLTRENNLLRQQAEKGQDSAPKVTQVQTILKQPPAEKPIQTDKSKIIESPESPSPEIPAEASPQTPTFVSATRTYQVQPGDTLTQISRKVYGNGNLWHEIYEVNQDQMENENDLKVGQIITIPARGN